MLKILNASFSNFFEKEKMEWVHRVFFVVKFFVQKRMITKYQSFWASSNFSEKTKKFFHSKIFQRFSKKKKTFSKFFLFKKRETPQRCVFSKEHWKNSRKEKHALRLKYCKLSGTFQFSNFCASFLIFALNFVKNFERVFRKKLPKKWHHFSGFFREKTLFWSEKRNLSF